MDNFFNIISGTENADGSFTYTLTIDPAHSIFGGHFPGKPVVPGVMTLMMTRRCAELAKGLGDTRIAAVKDAKYIAPITPDGRKVVINFSIDEAMNIKADVKADDGTEFTKIRMTLAAEA